MKILLMLLFVLLISCGTNKIPKEDAQPDLAPYIYEPFQSPHSSEPEDDEPAPVRQVPRPHPALPTVEWNGRE